MNKNILISVLVLIIIIVALYFYNFHQNKENVDEITQETQKPSIQEVEPGKFEVLPTLAKYGIVEKKEAVLPVKVDLKEDCTKALIKEGEYCYISGKEAENLGPLTDISVGLSEIYFEIPQNIDENLLNNAKVEIDLICLSGLGLYFTTESEEWARFGRKLPSQEYRADGSYGYLSCRYEKKEQRIITLPIEIHNRRAGVRIVQEEDRAYALINSVKLILE